jgi:hypothetical protein
MRRLARAGRSYGGRAGWLVLGLMAGVGCIFEARTPIVGEGQRSFWEPPTTPETIVRNLETAFENGIFNDYARALTEDFVFRPDGADSVQIELERPGLEIFVGWNREVETETAQAIKDPADSVDVVFTLFSDELIGDDHLRKEDYVVTLFQGGSEVTYEGQAWFSIRQIGGEWFIYEWEDVRTSQGAPTWGLLKGRNRP